MDDPRIEWIRDQVNLALDISDNGVFDEFINQDDGAEERVFATFLNDTPVEGKEALLFYKIVKEEEIEVEVEYGNLI